MASPKMSVTVHELTRWLRRFPTGHGAEVARARLAFMEVEGVGRFLRDLIGVTKIRPRVLITAQASGRWSTTGPNLPGRSRGIKKTGDVIIPDEGTFWLSFDHEAVESWVAAVYAQEPRDLVPLEKGEDLHCSTAQDIFGHPVPKDSPERQQAKTARYNLQYAYDYRGILESPDLAVYGGRQQALMFAKKYLDSRPYLQQAKQRVFANAMVEGNVRTAFGRLRRLTGDARTRGKDAWSHIIQGTISSVMNRLLLRILTAYPEARLIVNEHDGATLSFPGAYDPQGLVEACERLASIPWDLWGHATRLPTTWSVVLPEG